MNKKISDEMKKLFESVSIEHIQNDEQLLNELKTILNEVTKNRIEIEKIIDGIIK